MMRRLIGLIAIGWAGPLGAAVDFRREVWPILETHCIECHGAQKQKSSLRVDSRAALLKGGESGPAIAAGDPAKSHLLELVLSADEGERMPLDREPLPMRQIMILRRWIAEGADWPEDAVMAPAAARHWAYEPVQRPAVPGPDANPIDAFIKAKLAERGLRMSSAASPRTFIRRATLDFTGLPPTPEEVSAFERACVDQPGDGSGAPLPTRAVAALIDRLLASPRYGERWAQHWLDVIRYADTTGYESNAIRPNAWPYRDYVIAAFNADIPYPQFIFEQVAGDTVGVDAATGFLVTAPFPSRVEIGQERMNIAQFRFNGMDEALQNVGTAILGTTIGCARCHDHKFDPVSARDYYRMAATFSGLQFTDRPWRGQVPPETRNTEHTRRLAGLRRELATFPSWRETEPNGGLDVFQPVRARFVRLRITDTAFGRRYAPTLDEVEVWAVPAEGAPRRNVGAASAGAVARSNGADAALGGSDTLLNDGRIGRKSRWIADIKLVNDRRLRPDEAWVEIALAEPTWIDRVGWTCNYLDQDQLGDRVPGRWRFVSNWTIEVAEEPGQWRMIVPADRGAGLAPAERERRKQLEQQFKEAAQRRWEDTRVFAGDFHSPPATVHVLRRGDPQQPREPAGAGAIEIMGGYELPADAPEPERRVALAKWLGRPDHPLTARVLVNRVWRHHFGAGIVDTPGDFGTQGERPSHPELLDWLASEFVARGGRLKALHRLIGTSAAYAQSSRPDPAALRSDADSRLLWRFPPRRLEAEAIRDSLLLASGGLDLTMGGPGVRIFGERASEKDHGEWPPLDNPGPETWRRSIYLMRMRGSDDGVFQPFDVPNGGQVCAKRGVSTTPLQALNLFNSPFVNEQARRLAARAQREAGPAAAAQVERVFQLALARPPLAWEHRAGVELATAHGLAAVCRAVLNANEFLFLE